MNPASIQSLAAATQHIAHQQWDAAADCLDAVAAADPHNLAAHNLREQHRLRGNFSEWMGVNATLSPDDDIFRFFANHPTSTNPVRDYLSDGWRTMVELQELLERYDLSLSRCTSILEFASGHGRFTRHLCKRFTNGQLTVSDVVPGSVNFLQTTLGVKGFYSATNPANICFPQKYQVIFVLSLFSHLPPTVWQAWIRELYGALAPGGLLIFSTHGAKCAGLEHIDWGPEECRFFPSSESTALDGHTYGCTFASVAYVQRAIAQAVGQGAQVAVQQNHFWGNQDAIMLSAPAP